MSAKNDVALNGDFVLSDTLEIAAGQDIHSNTQLAALTSANLKADNDINLNSQFLNAADIAIEAKNNLTNAGKLVADNDLTVTVGNNLTNNDTILAQNNGSLTVGNATELNGTSVSAKTLDIKSGTLTNNAQIATDDTLSIATTGDITNNSKIAAGTDATLAADNIHNLGQIAAAGNINISTENDYINHRDSGLISGANLVIEAGKDIVNYLSEIFAGGDIELKGKDAKIGDVDPNKVYDNPNVDNNHTADGGGNNQFDIKDGEIDEGDDELEITLVDSGKKIILPPDAFAEEPNLGDSYTIDGYTIYVGERKITPAETPDEEPTISFEDLDKMTILDANGNEVKFTLWDDTEAEGETIDKTSGTDFKTSDKIDSQISSTPFEASQDQFNALVNVGGRIESLNNIDIKSDKLYNMGYHHNTGTAGYSTYYDKIRDSAPYNWGWLELGRYKINATHMDSEAASILAGNDLTINSRDILNQSSTFSAKNDAVINTAQLVNQTYSEIAQLPILKQMRTKKKKRFRTRKKTYNATEYYYERFYSKEKSLVTAGNNLVINAVDGNVINDQVEEPVGAFRFGRDEAPDLKSGQVPVDLTLPRGNNGMFAVSNNPKYMVTSTVDYFGQKFIGSDYFFDRITPFSNEYNTRKMLGDPAYETRLIMDAIRKATYGHYLGNGEISNDLDQMKALYRNAANEYERLDLKIGIALTPEQIKQLNSDIIWYVEKEINGEKVLVPELYLCDATLDKIKIGGYGAKMTGQNIAIAAGNISNSGDMFAKNEITLKAQNLLNESNRGHTARIIGNRTDIETSSLKNSGAKIVGDITNIKADDVHNEAKLYTENAVWGITRQEKDGSISGNNLNIETGSLTNIAGEINGGNISIKSDNITNTNRVFKDSKYYGNGYSHTETEGKQAKITAEGHLDIETGDITNRGSKIGGKTANIKADNILNETNVLTNESEAHGKKWRNYNLEQKTGAEATIYGDDGLAINVENNYISKGAKLESKNGDVSLEAGDVILESIELHNRSESYRKKKGTLKKKTTTSISDSLKNVGSSIVAGGNAFVNSVRDLFARGAKVEAGEDAQIVVGGDANIVAAQDHSYSFTKKTKSSWGGLKKSKDIVEHEENRLKGSNVKSSEGLTIVSGKDTNIVASDLNAGKDVNILAGYKAGADGKVEKSGKDGSVNILSGEETTKHREVHEKTDMTKGFTEIAKIAALNTMTGGMGAVITGNVGFKDGKLNMGMDLGEQTKDTWDNVQKNVVSSNITAGGDINLSATDNVNIKGSNVKSGNDIAITAGNNVNITSSQSTEDDKKTHSESKLTANAHVGHVAVDAVNSVDDVVKAAEEVKKATKELDRMRRLHAEGKASSQAVEDAELNLAAALYNQTTAIEAAATTMKEAANTKETLGFYAGGGITADTTKTESNASSTTNTASTIVADKNIKIGAGNDVNQIGSVVISEHGDIEYNVANDLNFKSSQDKYKSDSKTTQTSASATVSSKSGVGLNFANSDSSERASGTHHNNSVTLAEEGKITMNVGHDLNAEGYNALAKDVDINVKGDMKLASQQNTDYSNSKSNSFGIGGTSGGNLSGSIGQSKGSSDRQWVDNASSIVGTESVDIDVDGKLKMEGSLIANIDKDGKDAGNLDIKAGSIEAKDLQNFDNNKETGFNLAESYGPPKDGSNDGHPNGTTTIGLKNKGYEKEGVTKATIGQGNIEVADGSDISGINRDIDNMDVITKDQITGALDATVTIDNRMFTEEGRKEIVDDISNMGENAAQTAKNTAIDAGAGTKKIADGLITLYEGATGEIKIDDLSKVIADKNANVNIAYDIFRNHPELANALNNPNELSPEQIKELTKICQENGKDVFDFLVYTQKDNREGFSKDGNVAINIIGQDGQTISGDKLANILYYELTAHETGNATPDKYAEKMGDHGQKTTEFFNFLTGQSFGTDSISREEYNDKYAGSTLDQNNQYVKDNNWTQTANKPGRAVVVGAGALVAYNQAINEAGNGDPVLGAKLLQENPDLVPWYSTAKDGLEWLEETAINTADSVLGKPAELYNQFFGTGSDASGATNEFLQHPTEYILGGIGEVTSEQIDTITGMLKEAHPDKADEIDMWKNRMLVFVGGYAIGDGLSGSGKKTGTSGSKVTGNIVNDMIQNSGKIINTAEDIAKGYPGKIRQGIKTVTEKDFKDIKNRLLDGATELPNNNNYPGHWYKSKDGEIFGIRNSKKNGETIDFQDTNKITKIHYQ